MSLPAISLHLPDWLPKLIARYQGPLPEVESRMRLVIEFSRQNVAQGTGGPFGAAVFDLHTNRLVGAGVNVVVASGLSIGHAEIVALSMAEQRLGTFDLGATQPGRYELVTSTEPCAMCLGAIPWSGIGHVVCGASSADAAQIGFDEGPRHPQWIKELEQRDISVQTNICRDEARQVLLDYAAGNGLIYNGRQGD
ncbi:MAG TPA: nucleoside deaminase [Mariprofundaceae bacterium]|nr:nucleoside deaminase [Mariprofundaceae bacterium]